MYTTEFKSLTNDEVRVIHRRAMRLAANANHERHNHPDRRDGIGNPAIFELMRTERVNNLQTQLAHNELSSRGVN